MKCLSLLYHRVNECKPDPWTLSVSPAHFAQQMEVVSRLSPRPVLTFDDGYADNLHVALPILERFDVSAKFFVIAGELGATQDLWWDALDQLYAESEYAAKFQRLRLLHKDVRERELERLFSAEQMYRAARPERRMMRNDEVQLLATSKCAEIGAHTMTHPVLSLITPEAQEQEIRLSKAILEDLIDRPVDGFAYPNGMDGDYSEITMQIVKEAGFTHAYSAFEHPRQDAFQLPRVMIRNWDGDTFENALKAAAERAHLSLRSA